MNYTKIALLLLVCFLAYKFLYRAPEVEFGQYTGPGESAPTLSGREVVGHMRVHLGSRSYGAGHGFVLTAGTRKFVVSASHIIVGSFKDVDKVDVVSGTTTQLVGVNVCGHSQAGVAVPLPAIIESLDAI